MQTITRIFRPVMPLFILLLSISVSSGCGGNEGNRESPATTGQEDNQVIMQDNRYIPQSITVPSGTTVTWVNRDSYPHTVTSGARENPTDLFDSGNIPAEGTFSYTFGQAGTYPYYCTLHPGMDGTVTVQ